MAIMLRGWLTVTLVLLALCQLVSLGCCQASKEDNTGETPYATNGAEEYAIGGGDLDKAGATSQSESQRVEPNDSESESKNDESSSSQSASSSGEPNASQSESSSGEPNAGQSESSSGEPNAGQSESSSGEPNDASQSALNDSKATTGNQSNGSEPQPPAPTARQKRRFNCSHVNRSSSDADTVAPAVVLLNSTDFAELKAAVSPATATAAPGPGSGNQSACALLLYYLPYCPYSVALAPHYNALARAFPGLHFFAADADRVSPFYANYTASLAPYIRLFRDRDFLGVNTSLRTLDLLVAEVANLTGHSPVPNVTVTAADLVGPVSSSLARPTDYWLLLSCLYFGLLLPYLASGSARVRVWWARLRLGLAWRPHAD